MEKPSPKFFTVKEAAAYLRIPEPTMYYLVQQRKIEGIRIGGRIRIRKSHLDEHILGQRRQSILILDAKPRETPAWLEEWDEAESNLAVTGEEALNFLCSSETYGLLLMDIEVPDFSPLDLYRVIKNRFPKLPIVLMTSNPESPDLIRILSEHPAMVVLKPVKVAHLKQLVKTFVGGNSRRGYGRDAA